MPRISSVRLRKWRRSALLVLAIPICAAADAPATSGWNITNSTAALTGAATTAAVLQSSTPLLNTIGARQTAGLVLRCSEGTLAAYVAWPQVLTVNLTGFMGGLQTMVLWRVDDGPIAVNFWDRDDSGTAAGKFTTGGALKLIARLAPAKKLVVRMSGQTTQDAVFDLTGVGDAVAQVYRTCGVTTTRKE